MTNGRWVWRDREQEEDFLLTPEHIARIRTLAAGWDGAENGAASLMFPYETDAELDDGEATESLFTPCEIFLNSADPGDWAGSIASPYAHPPFLGQQSAAELESVPDQAVIAPLAAGETFAFQAEPAEIALWAEADLRGDGIDPKRPFGSGNVRRDIKQIIDPAGTLSKRDLDALIPRLESRMVLLLQYFLQHAAIEPGVFEQPEGWNWTRKEGTETDGAEFIDAQEWAQRLSSAFHYQTRDYSESCKCLAHLVWEDRVDGDYADMVRQFRLDNFYTIDTHQRYDGTTLDILAAGLEAFGGSSDIDARRILMLRAVRIYNSRADYALASALLEQWAGHISGFDPKTHPIGSPEGLMFFEWLIAARGTDAISDEAFRDLLFGSQRSERFADNPWDWVWKLAHEWDDMTYEDDGPFLAYIQGAAVQLMLMRGGYSANS